MSVAVTQSGDGLHDRFVYRHEWRVGDLGQPLHHASRVAA
jgi:hypothetical protein